MNPACSLHKSLLSTCYVPSPVGGAWGYKTRGRNSRDLAQRCGGRGAEVPGPGTGAHNGCGCPAGAGTSGRHKVTVQPAPYIKASSGSPAGVLSSPHRPIPGQRGLRVVWTEFSPFGGHGLGPPREGWPGWVPALVTSDHPPRAQCSGSRHHLPRPHPQTFTGPGPHTRPQSHVHPDPSPAAPGPGSFLRVETSGARPWSQNIEAPALGLATPGHLGSVFKRPGNHGGLLLCWRGHSELGQGRPAAERMWARGTPGMAKGLGAITGALPGAASTGRRTGQQKAISSLVQQCVQSWAEAAEGSHGLQGQKSARGPQGLGDKSDGSCVDGAAAPSEPEGPQPRGSRGECPCARRRGQTPPPRHGPGIPGKGSSGGLRVAAGGESQAT